MTCRRAWTYGARAGPRSPPVPPFAGTFGLRGAPGVPARRKGPRSLGSDPIKR
ncbi:MAG: hypothetical protein LBT40_03080 [Deltaproteobacteria bacterium]|nr:hypothetical protein [Deltaproteobacteria bacterium]